MDIWAFLQKAYVVILPIVLTVIGIPALWIISGMIQNYLNKLIPSNASLLLSRIIWYAGLIVITLTVLGNLGFNVSALIGTAGLIGVTVGFASQTSISNIISGIFLVCENAFKVGDGVTVGATSGKVEQINLFSIRLRTSENKVVRVPNEYLLKNPISIDKTK